jgi:hypothetical protein
VHNKSSPVFNKNVVIVELKVSEDCDSFPIKEVEDREDDKRVVKGLSNNGGSVAENGMDRWGIQVFEVAQEEVSGRGPKTNGATNEEWWDEVLMSKGIIRG